MEYARIQLREGNPVDAVRTRIVGVGSGSFDSDFFKTHRSSRTKQWKDFLDSFDLIGMPEQNVYSLLGNPDNENEMEVATYPKRVKYSLLSGFCGNGWQGFEIEFDTNKNASAWCMAQFMSESPWNRDNVVFVKDKTAPYSLWGRLVPKSVAKDYD